MTSTGEVTFAIRAYSQGFELAGREMDPAISTLSVLNAAVMLKAPEANVHEPVIETGPNVAVPVTSLIISGIGSEKLRRGTLRPRLIEGKLRFGKLGDQLMDGMLIDGAFNIHANLPISKS